jgi:hypothetical protein
MTGGFRAALLPTTKGSGATLMELALHRKGGAMSESGSEKRQRTERHTVRFTQLEDALLLAKANAAGVPVATLLRCAALDFPIPRQSRRPTSNHVDVARVLSACGKVTDAFERAASLLDPHEAQSARNDLAQMAFLCITALGRKP